MGARHNRCATVQRPLCRSAPASARQPSCCEPHRSPALLLALTLAPRLSSRSQLQEKVRQQSGLGDGITCRLLPRLPLSQPVFIPHERSPLQPALVAGKVQRRVARCLHLVHIMPFADRLDDCCKWVRPQSWEVMDMHSRAGAVKTFA